MPARFKNNASATIAASITESDTTIVLTTGFGAYFPTLTAGFYFYATLFDAANNSEIVRVTARSGDTLTVVRAQDGTTAKAFTAGDGFALRVVNANLENFVQLDGAQTISGAKTFSGANTFTANNIFSGPAVTINGTSGAYTGQLFIGAAQRHLRNVTATNAWEMVNSTNSAVLFTFDNTGNLTAAGDVTSNSDERLKSNIQTITHALAITKQLRGTAYIKDGKASLGLIAQEVQRILPQLVHEGADGYLSVSYGNIVAVLIEAVKELSARVEELEKE